MKKPVLLVVSACVVLILFCISLPSSLSATFHGERTTAVCTSVKDPVKRTGRRKGFRFAKYSFRFDDINGKTQSATIKYGAFWIKPKAGESVPIIYLEDSPDVIYYDSVLHVWMFPAIFGVLLVAMGAKQVLRLRSSMNS